MRTHSVYSIYKAIFIESIHIIYEHVHITDHFNTLLILNNAIWVSFTSKDINILIRVWNKINEGVYCMYETFLLNERFIDRKP